MASEPTMASERGMASGPTMASERGMASGPTTASEQGMASERAVASELAVPPRPVASHEVDTADRSDHDGAAWPVVGIVRAARRHADCSQRELARLAGIHYATVGRIEAGRLVPSLALLQRIVGATGFRLAVVDADGRVLRPMGDRDDIRDGAERRYPSHLDTILDPEPGEWWADVYGLARPPETFYRSRVLRDALRRRSQWEVRVAKYRTTPPPPDVFRSEWRRSMLPPDSGGRDGNGPPVR